MKYVLFIGNKVGYETIQLFTELNCHIEHAFIEKEHEHEHEKYYKKIINHCETNEILYSIDASNQIIHKIIAEIDTFDYIISSGYRKMISDLIRNKATTAALGTHFSPLPRYRGFAPLNWVLINGEEETAVNIFYLHDKVDNGDIIASRKVKIYYEDDINSLYDKCLIAFKKMIREIVPTLEDKSYKSEKQDEADATYTCARNPEDGLINWNWDSRKIYNFVRALTYPFPGAYTYIGGRKMIIWSCEEYNTPIYEGRIVGKVIKIIADKGVVVLCGKGAVLLRDVQLNGERQTADMLIRSIRLTLG